MASVLPGDSSVFSRTSFRPGAFRLASCWRVAVGLRLFTLVFLGFSLLIANTGLEVASDAPTVGQRVSDISLPEGSLIISVLRGGTGFVPKADTTIEAGDEVLLVLDPGLEEAITAFFAPNAHSATY